ncbi:MAG: hypothetical protein BA865_11755 [Desulfobacterales bacterium S5133MH4]|nr:MAG: hypothetical protein BA865_11755 [Desulfobacterales bacterium S5133MH4]
MTQKWSDWQDISGAIGYTFSAGWSPKSTDISEHAGQRVRIAFYHTDDDYGHGCESTGWYIDDIKLPGVFLNTCEGDFDNDGDVDGSDLAIFAADFGNTNCFN